MLFGAAEVAGNSFSALTDIRTYPDTFATARFRALRRIVSRIFMAVGPLGPFVPHAGSFQMPAAGDISFAVTRHAVTIAQCAALVVV